MLSKEIQTYITIAIVILAVAWCVYRLARLPHHSGCCSTASDCKRCPHHNGNPTCQRCQQKNQKKNKQQ